MPTTLPTTGPLALSNVNYVLSFANNRIIALDDFIVRSLFVKPTGTISIADGRGKAVGGSQSYTIPGTYYFTIPAYVKMTGTVNGAGGGGERGLQVAARVHPRGLPRAQRRWAGSVPPGAAPVLRRAQRQRARQVLARRRSAAREPQGGAGGRARAGGARGGSGGGGGGGGGGRAQAARRQGQRQRQRLAAGVGAGVRRGGAGRAPETPARHTPWG
jgi:hypothetical protein